MNDAQKSLPLQPTQHHVRSPRRWPLACLVLAVLASTAFGVAVRPSSPAKEPAASNAAGAPGYSGGRAEIERFLAYERDIVLTPQQEKVRVAALTPLPAPCCKSFSAATCCCPCNMAKATWGLAKHLIVHERAGAERVRAAVAAWHRAINPRGFSGDACFTGGCSRAFAKNGCGGMEKGNLVY